MESPSSSVGSLLKFLPQLDPAKAMGQELLLLFSPFFLCECRAQELHCFVMMSAPFNLIIYLTQFFDWWLATLGLQQCYETVIRI